ncbi:MAG TPA: iron-containing alcohol dehydrogenase, partial [Bacilli bacterium]|nr:iron-containing alcohol dehydrogenase [Bacilli bacterium]
AKLELYGDLVRNLERNAIDVVIYHGVTSNPTISHVEEALALYNAESCEALIGFGGGSPLDVAKVVAAKLARPNKAITKMKGILKIGKKTPLLIAVPTTSGTGSEATLAAVIIDEKTRSKYAINDPVLFPSYALLLPELTIALPKNITAETGMDVLTHAVEAYIGKSNTKYTRAKAINATRLVFEYLYTCYAEPGNLEARRMMQLASYDAGAAFTRAYVGNIHALSHPLSAYYGLGHGKTNAIIMPIVLDEYGDKVYHSLASLARAAGISTEVNDEIAAKSFINLIKELNRKMGIPEFIESIKDEDLTSLAHHAYKEANPLYPVPVIFNEAKLVELYKKIRGDNHETTN